MHPNAEFQNRIGLSWVGPSSVPQETAYPNSPLIGVLDLLVEITDEIFYLFQLDQRITRLYKFAAKMGHCFIFFLNFS